MSGREVMVLDAETGEELEGMRAVPARTDGESGQSVQRMGRASVSRPEDVVEMRRRVEELIQAEFEPGRDYGKIPGTKKPSLLKPGAEKARQWFGFGWTFPRDRSERIEDWESGFFHYRYTCVVHDGDGNVVGECEGSCNSREKKYDKDHVNVYDLPNTLSKMAQKRAFVGAMLFACGLSDRFTQDVEDMESFQGEPEPFDPDAKLGFGKHGGDTWREVAEDDPDYADWLANDADRPSEEAKAWLREQLSEGEPGSESSGGGRDEAKAREQAKSRLKAEVAKHFSDPDSIGPFINLLVAYRHAEEGAPENPEDWTTEDLVDAREALAAGGEEYVVEVQTWGVRQEGDDA